MTKNNWHEIQRGVPISNGSYFARLDDETGFIYDDQGGYLHYNCCRIDTRREITWIEHDQSGLVPVELNDFVIVETVFSKIRLKKARYTNWEQVARYRVVKQT